MRKTYTLNTKFFREWSSEMSYVLGYTYADGSMDRGKYRVRYASIDYQQLEMMQELLSSNKPIGQESNKNGEWYTWNIQNKEIYSDLRKLGIFPNKGLTMRLPDIPKPYRIDFIRGYFDGDGCIYEVKRKRPTPGMETDFATGSKSFAVDFTEMLNQEVGPHFNMKKKRKNYYNIKGHNVASEKFYEKAYYENCPHMVRKKDKFESILHKRNYNFLD